ncbi:hypothetical protein LO763_10110 [Glycomyces sp. A-F 0318]|uniref:hypothetical protein n=1 Tax=Glycomyces amatae TaxID=2881355 RepID=UPI001E2DEEB8|nr:hypothetical protein [Glycomyces amatae]MCD0443977.1 hypothetical protein [Glycomyces amatae]
MAATLLAAPAAQAEPDPAPDPAPDTTGHTGVPQAHEFDSAIADAFAQSQGFPSLTGEADFGSDEHIVDAHREGEINTAEAVEYGLASLTDPESVPEELRPTGPIEDPERYLAYLSAQGAEVDPARNPLRQTITAPESSTAQYDDCASPLEYNFHDYECQAFVGDFVFLYDVKDDPSDERGLPADVNGNGRLSVVQDMMNAIAEAQAAYEELGFEVDPGDGPWGVVVGLNETQEGWFQGHPFALPFGINDQPMIIMPSDPGWHDSDNYDYVPRHEFFHIVQYQYWDTGEVGWVYLLNWLGGSAFKSMNWWMESTAEWATAQSYRLQDWDPANPAAAELYARNVDEFLGDPGRALNAAGELGASRQYGAFVLPTYLSERTDRAFVRRTWERIASNDEYPIAAITATLAGYGLDRDSTLLGFAVANYRLAAEQGGAPPNPMAGYGYDDPDRELWRDYLGDDGTDDHVLGLDRPARTVRAVPLGHDETYTAAIEPGGAAYFDFSAVEKSGDPADGYESTLTLDTGNHDELEYVALVWSPVGSPGSLAEYPTAARAVYPNANGVITVTDFASPMVVTLIAARTDLNHDSAEADEDGRDYSWRVRALIPLDKRSCDLSDLDVGNLEADAAPQQLFLDYADSTPNGWTGGDSTYSVRLPDGDLLWLFSDTFLGPLNDDGTRPTSAPLVNSTFVRQDGNSLSTIQGGTAADPAAIMPPSEANHWFWLGDGMISRQSGVDYLQVVYQEYYRYGTGAWDWAFKRNVVATFSLNDLSEPLRVDELPSQAGAWGSALLPASQSGDGYTYVYGLADAQTNKKQRIARVHGSNLNAVDKWQYWTPDGWTAYESDAGIGLNGIANEYSVTKWNGQYVLVSQDSTLAFDNEVYAYTSCSPAGPFTNQSLIFAMPETGPWGSYGDKDVFAYNPHIHQTLSSGNTFTLSYNVNHFDTTVGPDGAHYRDPSIYQPRFITFTLS